MQELKKVIRAQAQRGINGEPLDFRGLQKEREVFNAITKFFKECGYSNQTILEMLIFALKGFKDTGEELPVALLDFGFYDSEFSREVRLWEYKTS